VPSLDRNILEGATTIRNGVALRWDSLLRSARAVVF